ncbi:MAG TPA: hypothetical protein QGF58_19775, partial [Myxococcota bacterium]|nr:hypothetical protein [Myxococcota bacterium]
VRYEGGLALSHTWMGEPTRDCEFRYNYLHETFDGEKLGYFSSSQSHHNVYAYNYDNHVELEGDGMGSTDLRLHHNLMLACPLGPISHQSEYIVGPQWVYRNVVLEYDEDHGHTWTQLKTYAPNATEGLHFFHNTFQAGHTTMFYLDADKLILRNNILIFSDEYSDATELDSDYNLLVNLDDEPWLRGEHGSWLGDDPAALKLDEFYAPGADSPAIDAGVLIDGFNKGEPDVGAFELGEIVDADWPRPRETVFVCDLPERWEGEDPGLCDEPVDTGSGDSGDSGDGGDSGPTDSAPIDPGDVTDEPSCGCASGQAAGVLAVVAWMALRRRRSTW